jgi:hypothetical protein
MQSRMTSSKLGISQLASGIFSKKRGSSNLKKSGSPSKANKIRERLRASRLGVQAPNDNQPGNPSILDKITLAQSIYVPETPDLEEAGSP